MNCDRLDVWHKAVALSIQVYRGTTDCRNFGFVDQITRSALSISSNIAEGLEKKSQKDQLRFLEYSKGSTAEFITQTIVGIGAGFIDNQMGLAWKQEAKSILGMIVNLEKYIQGGLQKP